MFMELPSDCVSALGREAALDLFPGERACTQSRIFRGRLYALNGPLVTPKSDTVLYLLVILLARGLIGSLYPAFHTATSEYIKLGCSLHIAEPSLVNS